MKHIGKAILATTIALGGIGAVSEALHLHKAEASELSATTATIKDNGATITLKLVNHTSSITINEVAIQELRDGEWVEPDYNRYTSILYPDAGWNYEDIYYLKGPGGEIPSSGTYRFKISTTDENGTDLGTITTNSFTF